ncbi:helix-turn-helix transcriptional regulator [Bacillus vallismortis]|uniref:helix-turn-helix domain-containing protein n=1 Tax=Bacillus vallismortis TaxID=72361 RepID=UPI0034613F96
MQIFFGENVGKIMTKRGLTQKKLKELSKVSRQTINKTLQLTSQKDLDISLTTALSIAKALNVDFPSLFSRITTLEDMNKYRDDNYLIIYSENVKRLHRGNLQKYLSTQPGVSESTISEILNLQVNNPKLSSMIYISEALGCHLSELLRREG